MEHKRGNKNQTKPKQKTPRKNEGRVRRANTAHITVSGYTGAQRNKGARHTLSNSPGDIWSYIHQLLTLERLLLIEAVTNQTEKEALVAKEGAGFKFCKPCALHCPAPQKHGTGRAPLQPGGARSLGEANSGADFTFQSESMHVDTCAHPPVSGQASVAMASSPPRPLSRLGGQGRHDPPLILHMGRGGPRPVLGGARGQPSHTKSL